MYAVIAPGLKGIYQDQRALDCILKLYPYATYQKCSTVEDAQNYLQSYTPSRSVADVQQFGETTFLRIIMQYFVRKEAFYYNFDTSKFGTIRILDDSAIVDNRLRRVSACIQGVQANPERIRSHLIAIYRGLKLVGELAEVEVIVPDQSIFYAIHSYTGTDKTITRVRNYIKSRPGAVSFSLDRRV